MKRFIICLFVLVVSFSFLFSFAEEENTITQGDFFSLHNGITFGMTREEVIAIEKKAGVILESFVNPYNGYVNEDTLVWKGRIAGKDNSELSLSFYSTNHDLFAITYSFSSVDSYESIENGLIKKYGLTDYNSERNEYIPSKQPQMDEIGEGCMFEGLMRKTVSGAKYSQRLIPYNDNQSILILHSCYQETLTILDLGRYKQMQDAGFGDFLRDAGVTQTHYVSYMLLDESDTRWLKRQIEQQSNDL